jgi:hypothetical protein
MADDPLLGMTVVQKADGYVGKRVGNGECFDFVDYVLRAAGARSARDYGKVTPNGNYVWGTLVNEVSHSKTGDVIQYDHFRLKETTTVVTKLPDGTTTSTSETKITIAHHHTAVVKDALHNGRMNVYEQYVDGEKFVQINNMPIGSNYMKDVKTVGGTTTTVVVHLMGSLKIYRPQRKKP